MAHMKIAPNGRGGYSVIVDGVEMADKLLPDGLSISPVGSDLAGSFPLFQVTLRLLADVEADIPDAIVVAEHGDA